MALVWSEPVPGPVHRHSPSPNYHHDLPGASSPEYFGPVQVGPALMRLTLKRRWDQTSRLISGGSGAVRDHLDRRPGPAIGALRPQHQADDRCPERQSLGQRGLPRAAPAPISIPSLARQREEGPDKGLRISSQDLFRAHTGTIGMPRAPQGTGS